MLETSFLRAFNMLIFLIQSALFYTVVISAGFDIKCVTPNGENAECVKLENCDVIKKAIMTGNESAILFYHNSKCDYHNEPSVCCGTSAFPISSEVSSSKHHFFNTSICGYQTPDDRVLGGTLTEIGEFPWITLLGYIRPDSDEISFNCGGTLINNRYILTAAHCLKLNRLSGIKLDLVRLGEWRISTQEDCNEGLANEECADPVIDIKIEKQIPHLRYSKRSGNNDIALLRLEKTVKYSDYIQPICLPSENEDFPEIGTPLTVSGWGSVEDGSQSDIKLKVLVPIVSLEYCNEQLMHVGNVTEYHICAGGEKGKDACKGDSGGPLMHGIVKHVDDKAQWYQEGIIAWGIGCRRKNVPGVYSRVSKYINWIKENIY